jgi:hypothetical protein
MQSEIFIGEELEVWRWMVSVVSLVMASLQQALSAADYSWQRLE